MKKVVTTLVIFQLFSATTFSAPGWAQQGNRGKQNADSGENTQKREINPAWLDKFTGVGRQDDFQQAIKEERAGWRLMLDKKWDLAINKFKQATQIYPNLPAAYMAIGQAVERSGGPNEDAEAAYRTAIKLDEDDYRAWHKLAGILIVEKKYIEARKALGKAVMLSPPARERKIIDRMINMCESSQQNGKVDPQDDN